MPIEYVTFPNNVINTYIRGDKYHRRVTGKSLMLHTCTKFTTSPISTRLDQ